MEAGGCPDRFWRQTPRLIRTYIKGRNAAAKQRQRLAMSQAWYTAMLYRADTIPPLAELMGDPVEPQTDDDITFNLSAFAASTEVSSAT